MQQEPPTIWSTVTAQFHAGLQLAITMSQHEQSSHRAACSLHWNAITWKAVDFSIACEPQCLEMHHLHCLSSAGSDAEQPTVCDQLSGHITTPFPVIYIWIYIIHSSLIQLEVTLNKYVLMPHIRCIKTQIKRLLNIYFPRVEWIKVTCWSSFRLLYSDFVV